MDAGAVSKRARCERCLRAQSNCICSWIRPVTPVARVLILQHPLEITQAKGSGRLLHLSLAGSVLAQGEQFDDEPLRDLLFGGGFSRCCCIRTRQASPSAPCPICPRQRGCGW